MTTFRNPCKEAQRAAMFWRLAFCLVVPPMFLALVAMTHFVHREQGYVRHNVAVSLLNR